MLPRLRQWVKTPLVAGSTAGLYVVWRTLEPAARAVGREDRLRHLMFRAWARASERFLAIRVKVEGTPPEGPCLLVTNHLSYLDIALLARRHDATFVSMAEVAAWPGMGKMAKELGTIFVDRERRKDAARAAEQIQERLARGETVVLFPEGRAGDGTRINPFHSPLLEPAAKLGLPVRWAALGYFTPPGQPSASAVVCWTESVSFGEHLYRLMRLPRIDARIAYGDAPIQDDDRKRLAKRLEEAVRSRFRPVATPAPALARV